MSYNGWTNYETWNVALWIDNEPGTYKERREMARAAWEGNEDDEDAAVRVLADSLKSWVEDMRPDLGASMFSDLLGAALSEVDWHEMAVSFLDDDRPEPEESEEETEVAQ